MLPLDELRRCAGLLTAFAEVHRIRIILLLFGGPKNVGQLTAELQDQMARVSHHLAVLRDAGVVTATKVGRYVDYALHPDVYTPNVDAPAERVIRLGSCRLAFPPADNADDVTVEKSEHVTADHPPIVDSIPDGPPGGSSTAQYDVGSKSS